MTDVSEEAIVEYIVNISDPIVMDFGDLVASAEQLTAEIDGAKAGDLPRVERSLKHILDAGQSLLGKSSGQGQDAKASILLGSRGVDLPAISSKIGAIQSTNIVTESEKVCSKSRFTSTCDKQHSYLAHSMVRVQ